MNARVPLLVLISFPISFHVCHSIGHQSPTSLSRRTYDVYCLSRPHVEQCYESPILQRHRLSGPHAFKRMIGAWLPVQLFCLFGLHHMFPPSSCWEPWIALILHPLAFSRGLTSSRLHRSIFDWLLSPILGLYRFSSSSFYTSRLGEAYYV